LLANGFEIAVNSENIGETIMTHFYLFSIVTLPSNRLPNLTLSIIEIINERSGMIAPLSILPKKSP